MVLSKFRTKALIYVSLLVFFIALGLFMIYSQNAYFLGAVLLLSALLVVFAIFSLVKRTM